MKETKRCECCREEELIDQDGYCKDCTHLKWKGIRMGGFCEDAIAIAIAKKTDKEVLFTSLGGARYLAPPKGELIFQYDIRFGV